MKVSQRSGFHAALHVSVLFLGAWAASALFPACASYTDAIKSAWASAREDPSAVPAGAASLSAARAAIDVQRYRTQAPEARAASVPADISTRAFAKPSSGLPGLVNWLLEGQVDPYLKAKILHDWEALNISYDVKAYYSGGIPDQSAYSVLKRKSAVCAGYSSLYKALCDLGGVKCAQVSGQARGTNFSEGKGLMGHDWNAVQIEGVWRLVDVTWDSCYVNSPTEYGHNYGSAYFLLEPEFMVYTHFPDNASMQLLDRRLSLEEFNELPYADGEFLSVTRRSLPGLAIANKSTGLSTIDIPHGPGVRLMASLQKSGSKKAWTGDGKARNLSIPVVEGEGKSTFTLSFPSKGDYIFSVSAMKEEDLNMAASKGASISVGTCQFRFSSSGASKRTLVGFDAGFQKIAGLPLEGGVLDAHVRKELRLTFACGPELSMQASLSRGDSEHPVFVQGATAMTRISGGYRLIVAFPSSGTYNLSISAETSAKKRAWTSLPLIADEAADHGYLDFPQGFLELTGEPLGGSLVSDRAGAEFTLTFPAASGVELNAWLGTVQAKPNQTSITSVQDSRRRCVVQRAAGGLAVKVGFPGPGDYCLSLEAKGPKGEKILAGLFLKAGAGLDHGYANLDPRLVEFAGRPSLRGPDGAPAGELGSDIVGKRLDLLFPKADAPLGASLYMPRVAGNTTTYEWANGLTMKKTDAGWLATVIFPGPGDYAIFFREDLKEPAKGRTFDGLYLTSR